MVAALDAAQCLLSSVTPKWISSATPQQQLQQQQSSNAAVAACVSAALESRPDAAQALAKIFSPTCGLLTTSQCAARAGCYLQEHGDHSDCVRTAMYASEYLLRTSSSPQSLPAASTPQVQLVQTVADVAQQIADSCRLVSATSYQGEQLNMEFSSRGSTIVFLAAAAGVVLPAEGDDVAGGADNSAGGESGAGVTENSSMLTGAGGKEDDAIGGDDEDARARKLRIGALFAVLVAGFVGICIPMVLRVSLWVRSTKLRFTVLLRRGVWEAHCFQMRTIRLCGIKSQEQVIT